MPAWATTALMVRPAIPWVASTTRPASSSALRPGSAGRMAVLLRGGRTRRASGGRGLQAPTLPRRPAPVGPMTDRPVILDRPPGHLYGTRARLDRTARRRPRVAAPPGRAGTHHLRGERPCTYA